MTALVLGLCLALGAVHSSTPPLGVTGTAPLGGSLTASAEGVRTGRDGTITHMGAGFPANYLAIPIGPGHRVKVCGPRACLTLTSTDAGPNRKMLQAGRIADVSVELFAKLCCDPSRGVFRGSWKLLGPDIPLPETDTAP